MYRAGIRSILSQLAREDRIAVVDTFGLESPQTKLAVAKLKSLGLDSELIITDADDEHMYLAPRNLTPVAVVEHRYAGPLSLIHSKKELSTDRQSTRLNYSH